MHIVIAGASGLVGSALSARLGERGDTVLAMRRGGGRNQWDPTTRHIDPAALEGADALVNLSGESIGGRWTAAKKARLRDSRLDGTALLAEAVAAMPNPPRVFINGSAIGYYGSRADQILDEQSERGSGFLADLAADWEAATQPASGVTRVALARTSLVLSASGGSLQRLLLPFKLGVGGRIGPGSQYWSWISLADEVRALIHILDKESVDGPVNLAAPQSVPNREFVKSLGAALHRPALLPVPSFALKILVGSEFADEVLLGSQRVVPTVLDGSGFVFEHPTLAEVFEAIL